MYCIFIIVYYLLMLTFYNCLQDIDVVGLASERLFACTLYKPT